MPLTKIRTNCRNAAPPAEQLAVNQQFLATCNSHGSVTYLHRISKLSYHVLVVLNSVSPTDISLLPLIWLRRCRARPLHIFTNIKCKRHGRTMFLDFIHRLMAQRLRLAPSKGSNRVGAPITLPQDGNRYNFWSIFFFRNIWRWTKSKSMFLPSAIHHHQNLLELSCKTHQ